MCGIGLLLFIPEEFNQGPEKDEWNNILSQSLSSRGPDLPCHTTCHEHVNGATLTLHGSVLHMRGACPSAQPLEFYLDQSLDIDGTDKSCALCWNGECYTYSKDRSNRVGNLPDNESCSESEYATMIELVTDANDIDQSMESSINSQSDTILVKELLSQSVANTRQHTDDTCPDVHFEHKAVASTLARIHGEYSFIIYVPSPCSATQGCIYYGRDVLGRRSLLINRAQAGVVVISSVATRPTDLKDGTNCNAFDNGWEELPPGIVYRMDTATGKVTTAAIPRIINTQVQTSLSSVVASMPQSIDDAAKQLLYLLDKSVHRRVMNAPMPKSKSQSDASVAILFSGGIDSVLLAALSDRHVPPVRPIDLINVSFYDDSDSNSSAMSPDRLAALCSYCEMATKWPDRHWRFIAVDVSYREVLEVESKVIQLISPLDSTMDFNIAVAFWFAGRGKGRIVSYEEASGLINGIGNQTAAQKSSKEEPLLRYASCGKSKPIKRQTCVREGCKRPAPGDGCIFNACKFCCGKLQSPICKFLGQRAQICSAHDSGKKTKQSSNTYSKSQSCTKQASGTTITSAAKILISGVGADEQCAGYGRHRTTFQRGGYEKLRDELKMEVGRLWTRNLGRDDRCLSDCGKEARFPFLDEDVVAYLEALPLQLKCNLNLPQGEGDKLILRKVARMIGTYECSALVKRAIQFGSRIAKVSDKNRYGSQRQASGEAKHIRE